MNNIPHKKLVMGIATALLVIAAFFAGKAYGSGHARTVPQNGMMANGAFNRGGMRGGATIGQVIAKDATSITVSTVGGGSKIILYSPSTSVSKSAEGSIDDVSVGSTITATGTANPDGSVAASTIQVRPTGSVPAKQ